MLNLLLRRLHLYLALFLAPWVLLYAISTFVMNHRDWFRGQPAPPPVWRLLATQTYAGQLPEDAPPKLLAQQLLATAQVPALGGVSQLGAFQASRKDGQLIVVRHTTLQPLRFTLTLATRELRVEQQQADTPAFLERMHRRRGFQHDFFLEDAWALSVDLFIVAMLAWTLTGLWMWWSMRPTRPLGLLFLFLGCALFAAFLRWL